MNRIALMTVVGMVLPAATTANAQVYQVYYAAPAPAYYQPAPVTTYYAPAPHNVYYAPATTYYAPAPVAIASVPVATTYYRPLLGGTITRTRYVYTPVTYAAPVTYSAPATVAYYPAY